MQRFLGCHVSTAGGLAAAIHNGKALEVNTIQLHPSPPQRWNTKPYPKGFEDEFNEARKGSGIEKVFFHGIYLINLANPEPQKQHLAKVSLVHYLDLNARIEGDGVIFHVGSNTHQEKEEDGFALAGKAINAILKESHTQARLILEVAAGSGKIIGDRVEELAAIFEHVQDQERVGFGLDSQHLWASGYDLQGNLEEIVDNFERVLGLQKIWAIHLNDSKTECGSKKDRHENLGQGLIGSKTLAAFINHPKLAKVPVILETPDLDTPEGALREVAALRKLANL
ncbi:MAG: deoxyribonuclease IV [Bdellovibrionota bacterium]|nr:MAG: deoxyribonuclease IV [Bdellovibrionota bacterium]